MRTTLTLEDDLAAALKERSFRSGQPFKAVVNATIRRGLAVSERATPRKYRLRPASLGDPAPGLDLTHALRLAETLEETQFVRDLELRK